MHNSLKKLCQNLKRLFRSEGAFHPIIWLKVFMLIFIFWILWRSYSPGIPVEDYVKEVFSNAKTFAQEVVEDFKKFTEKDKGNTQRGQEIIQFDSGRSGR